MVKGNLWGGGSITSSLGRRSPAWSSIRTCTRRTFPLRILLLPGHAIGFGNPLDELNKVIWKICIGSILFEIFGNYLGCTEVRENGILNPRVLKEPLLKCFTQQESFSYIMHGSLENTHPRMPWSGWKWHFDVLEFDFYWKYVFAECVGCRTGDRNDPDPSKWSCSRFWNPEAEIKFPVHRWASQVPHLHVGQAWKWFQGL